ncbi:hypothetical protein P152DRAFT_461340 [Eremomyces bilateralis CBS 781.70]|uniref:Methyltransferase domain-containing protein n=1 Tax=Eremomyces bilateralis CBS 781.70 TaxID=1392243 RepID=A0A6G1FV13_9PEZI|nr:uncharacterized protein P152DRAFT_461340 [Eremomyces bilateralis CBS 781.70]KAF1809657.1 hypothetical protein P152DRAFT_461340 [Eremomyces bilateralis CBS 781.70]
MPLEHGELPTREAYEDAVYPEFYDMLIPRLFSDSNTNEDIRLAVNQMNDMHVKSASDRFAILDIGTGTGRAALDLVKAMRAEETLHGNIFDILLLEPSASMLVEAVAKLADLSCATSASTDTRAKIGDVQTFQILAEDLGETLSDKGLLGKIDFAMFTAGGLSHITDEQDLRRFLKGTARCLNADHGRLMLSILNEFISDQLAEEIETVNTDETVCFRSQKHPGMSMTKYPTKMQIDPMTGCRTDSFVFETKAADGEVEKRILQWTVRMTYLKQWEEMLAECGLTVEETRQGKIQKYWLLKRA